MTYGGPQLLGRTVGNLVGVQPDYVLVAGFPTFRRLIAGIGGITVDNPRRFSDPYLEAEGFPVGRVKLNDEEALAFARIRKSLPAGDFDRSANQQRVLRGIQQKIRQKAGTRGFLAAGALSVLDNMDTRGASPAVLFRIAHAVASLKPSKFTTCVLQGAIGDVGGASVVLPYTDQAKRFGNQARDDATLENC